MPPISLNFPISSPSARGTRLSVVLFQKQRGKIPPAGSEEGVGSLLSSIALGVPEPKQEALQLHPSWAERMYSAQPTAVDGQRVQFINLVGPSLRTFPLLTLHHRVACVELSAPSHSSETGYLAVLLALLDGGVDVMTCGTGRLICSRLFPEQAEGFVR